LCNRLGVTSPDVPIDKRQLLDSYMTQLQTRPFNVDLRRKIILLSYELDVPVRLPMIKQVDEK